MESLAEIRDSLITGDHPLVTEPSSWRIEWDLHSSFHFHPFPRLKNHIVFEVCTNLQGITLVLFHLGRVRRWFVLDLSWCQPLKSWVDNQKTIKTACGEAAFRTDGWRLHEQLFWCQISGRYCDLVIWFGRYSNLIIGRYSHHWESVRIWVLIQVQKPNPLPMLSLR